MENLAKYFKAKGVDDITDEETFLEAEHEAMVDYFNERSFFLSDEDTDTLIARGLMREFELAKMNWEQWHNEDCEDCEHGESLDDVWTDEEYLNLFYL